MKKKDLSGYRPPAVTEQPQEGQNYVLCEVIGQGKNAVLAVNVYAENNSPRFTVFCSYAEKRYISWDYKEQKWREAMINNLLWRNWWSPRFRYVDVGDTKAAARYLLVDSTKSTVRAIQDWQQSVLDERNLKRHEKRQLSVHEVTDHLPEITAPIRAWVDRWLMIEERYVYYTRDRQHVRGYCTHCRNWHEWTVDKKRPTSVPALDKEGKCQSCGSRITWKSLRRSASFSSDGIFTLLTRTPHGLMISVWHAHRRFERENLEKSGIDTIYPTGIQMLDAETLQEIGCYEWETRTAGHKNIADWYAYSDTRRHPMETAFKITQPLYPGTVKRALSGTPYAYVGLELLAKRAERVNVLRYLYHAKKLPLIESAGKVGLARLVCELLDRYNPKGFRDVFINPSNSLSAALGVSRPDLTLLRVIDAGCEELEFLRECRKQGRRCDRHILLDIRRADFTYSWRQKPKAMLAYGHPDTILRYLKKQTPKNRKLRDVYGDWMDYIGECKKLKWDIKDRSVLFPQDLWRSHEQTSMLVSYEENKSLDAKIRKRLAGIGETYTYETTEYIARPAISAWELATEGKKLHHCVGGYAKRMADGECIIILIRRKSAPDTPLTTAEMRGERCIQIRALRNADPLPSVKNFWSEYMRVIKKRLQTEKQRSAG